FPGTKTFSDSAAMLNEIRPDIVSVATLPTTHRAIVEQCAAHKTPLIFCEKPISETRDDAERMIEACRRAKSLLLIDHTRRFDRFIRAAGDAVKKGEIGEIQYATAYYTAGLYNT